MKIKAIHSNKKKSIFSALFIPLFVIMIFQAIAYYGFAVYGGIEETVNKNAEDILAERLINRKNEIETLFTKSWTNLETCQSEISSVYANYCEEYGDHPLADNDARAIDFINSNSDILVSTLRKNEVNGIYLIINNKNNMSPFDSESGESKIGIGIRDMDQTSNYTGREDLLLERAPSSLIDKLACSLDSWWEARYSFEKEEDALYFYQPMKAAWKNPDVDSEDLAYFQGAHNVSGSDQSVVSYSIPLMDSNGYPYAVLGIELTTQYLDTLMPYKELSDNDKSCYALAVQNVNTGDCVPITGTGAMYIRCFATGSTISVPVDSDKNGFDIEGRDSTRIYGKTAAVDIYNNNNPFENQQLVLIAMVEHDTMYAYISSIKKTLAIVTGASLLFGLAALVLVSRHFSQPITALAGKVKELPPKEGYQLDHLGITEIDQLVDSIENLNRNASRDIARTEFFSRMSHDMRTPMNAIISFSSPELLEGTNDKQKLEYLEKIHSSGTFLLGLINEVLDMTKIESNKVDIQYSPLKTACMWDTIVSIIDKLAQKKHITFLRDISMMDTVVMADEQHLNQIVMNLLSNAVKFTPEGGTVQFAATMNKSDRKENEYDCMVVVKDTGIGMSKEFMKNLYKPFVQEHEGREGTGLGLSIAKKLIELMGGTINCSSVENEGTTFKLYFSLEGTDSKGEAASEINQPQNVENLSDQELYAGLKGKNILVCEDQPLNIQIIVRILQRVGINVETAVNGQIGYDTFVKSELNYFDGVLMDIRMPVMDGLETAKAIRALDREDAHSIPIIAMTANAFSEDERASQKAGMNAHLSKPINMKKLYSTLSFYLCNKE